MKKTGFIAVAFLILLLAGGRIFSETELSEEYQQELFDRLNHLRDHGPRPASMADFERPICGTPDVFNAFINQDRLTGAFKTAAVMQGRDTTLENAYASPGGHFLIHYDIVGFDAVYKPDLDTLDGGDGIPDYINKIGEIADSVWAFAVDKLGFPAPPADDFYAEGLDARYDIYINSLGSAYYGATYSEVIVNSQSVTSVLVLDNDYNFYPYNQYNDWRDLNRRLDAVRVTMAHEFFHAIHFGMDWTEWEGDDPGLARIYWWEMSAVWMEEMMYDDINDYYGYLPTFFNLPWIGLRNFTTTAYPLAIHPYGAVVFPIYLTERWGDTTIVRRIWEYCRDLGVGPQFGDAVDLAVSDVSGGTYHLADAIREFSVWNLFTGSRASRAPAGIGYSERANYPAIPDTALLTFDEYPLYMTNIELRDQFDSKLPEIFGVSYIRFDNAYLFPDSFNVYFYRPAIYSTLDWNFSLVGIPLDDFADGIVQMNLFEGTKTKLYSMTNPEDLYYVYGVVAPSTPVISVTNYRKTYDFSFVVLDEPLPGDSALFYNFFSPYPNPCFMTSSNADITFRIEKSVIDFRHPSMEVMIYDVAGEKIRELHGEGGQSVFATTWNLKNESGNEVAPGVYLALCRLRFHDGSEDMVKKYRLAVIR